LADSMQILQLSYAVVDTVPRARAFMERVDILLPRDSSGRREIPLNVSQKLLTRINEAMALIDKDNKFQARMDKLEQRRKRNAVVAITEALRDGPATYDQVFMKCPEFSVNTIRQTLSAMVAAHHLDRPERGWYALPLGPGVDPGQWKHSFPALKPKKIKNVGELVDAYFASEKGPATLEAIRNWGVSERQFNKGLDVLLFELNQRQRIGAATSGWSAPGCTVWELTDAT